MRRREEFRTALRAPRRTAGRPASLLVVHLQRVEDPDAGGQPRSGFVVSRAVGGAVVRNRVRRRLRHLVAARLSTLPTGSRLVVRALPASAGASSTALGAALDEALTSHLQVRSS
jgi:ribonuclease P protein component